MQDFYLAATNGGPRMWVNMEVRRGSLVALRWRYWIAGGHVCAYPNLLHGA